MLVSAVHPTHQSFAAFFLDQHRQVATEVKTPLMPTYDTDDRSQRPSQANIHPQLPSQRHLGKDPARIPGSPPVGIDGPKLLLPAKKVTTPGGESGTPGNVRG